MTKDALVYCNREYHDRLFEHKIWKINEVAHMDKEKIHCMKMRRTLEEGKEAQELH